MMQPDLEQEIALEIASIRKNLADISRVHLEMAEPDCSPTIVTGGGIESILK